MFHPHNQQERDVAASVVRTGSQDHRSNHKPRVPMIALSKCLRRVYSVLQGCRPGVGASRRVIRPTIDHLTIATEVVVSRS